MPWKPGQSGNPGGRKAIPREYRHLLDSLNADALAFWKHVLTPDADGNYTHPKAWEVSQLVAHYNMGKPVENDPAPNLLTDGQVVARQMSESDLLALTSGSLP